MILFIQSSQHVGLSQNEWIHSLANGRCPFGFPFRPAKIRQERHIRISLARRDFNLCITEMVIFHKRQSPTECVGPLFASEGFSSWVKVFRPYFFPPREVCHLLAPGYTWLRFKERGFAGVVPLTHDQAREGFWPIGCD